MKAKIVVCSVMTLALALTSPGALADQPSEPYFGIGLGVSFARDPLWQGQVDSPFDQAAMRAGRSPGQAYPEPTKRAGSARVFAGVWRGWVGVEAGYTLFGTMKADTDREGGHGTATMTASSVDLSLMARHQPSGVFARMGVQRARVEVESHLWLAGGEEKIGRHRVASTGPVFGLGWEGDGWRVEWIRHSGVGLTDVTGKHEVDTLILSVKF